jgi:hypothetical protein
MAFNSPACLHNPTTTMPQHPDQNHRQGSSHPNTYCIQELKPCQRAERCAEDML